MCAGKTECTCVRTRKECKASVFHHCWISVSLQIINQCWQQQYPFVLKRKEIYTLDTLHIYCFLIHALLAGYCIVLCRFIYIVQPNSEHIYNVLSLFVVQSRLHFPQH